MHQWTPDQLLHAAMEAERAGRLQDAVTVLAYLIQTQPRSEQAGRARDLYRQLTGTDCPEALAPALAEPQPDGVMAPAGALASDMVSSPEPPDRAEAMLASMRIETAGQEHFEESRRQRQSGLLDELDIELTLESDQRLGLFLAHLFFILGFLLLPVGVLMLVFSLAYGFLFGWGLLALAGGLPLIALGQLLRMTFETHRLLKSLGAGEGGGVPSDQRPSA